MLGYESLGVDYDGEDADRSEDGGGVRGLSSLKLLQALMAKIDPSNPDQPPYRVFDMIGGTSTGGKVAVLGVASNGSAD